MAETSSWWSSPWLVLAAAAAATYLWRALGVAVSGRIRPGGAVFAWVGCVAYALLAGLVARMILLPLGPLQDTGLAVRLGAAAMALAVFYLARRSIFLGVLAGTVTLAVLAAGG